MQCWLPVCVEDFLWCSINNAKNKNNDWCTCMYCYIEKNQIISMYMERIYKVYYPMGQNYSLHVMSGDSRGSQKRPREPFQMVSLQRNRTDSHNNQHYRPVKIQELFWQCILQMLILLVSCQMKVTSRHISAVQKHRVL